MASSVAVAASMGGSLSRYPDRGVAGLP